MSLVEIIRALEARRQPLNLPYFVPGLWASAGADTTFTAAIQVDPYRFYHERLNVIATSHPQRLVSGPPGGEWSRRALVYNLFPRVTTAFDHDADGEVSIVPNRDGWRETGTLLKCIALLPYIQGMGFNTVHLLPILSIGQDGKKGTLGSPYAIRNQYQLDSNLDEPALGLSAEQLFAGFVEAAHLLGLRVVMEFVLRTASKDSDWIPQHPEWFYWIRADIPDRGPHMGRTASLNSFGQPLFGPDTLGQIFDKVNRGDPHDLPPPSAHYRHMFTPPPRPEKIVMEGGRYLGTLEDGTQVRVPGAFTDWPPNDGQPPWTDVTYLRMYDHPDFNYMAYNTLRMYDARLSAHTNRIGALWDAIAGVIPYYQERFGIDGVLLDMGHALPGPLRKHVIASARAINPDFAFWDENFSISQHSRDEGYNAVVGYWLLGLHEGHSVRNNLHDMARYPFPIGFFGAPENHNTPRAFGRFGGVAYAHYALALSVTVPAIPFILSGFELGETQAVNTGLGFSYEQIARNPAEQLPLFSEWAFDWTRPENYVKSVRYALTLRRKYENLLADNAPATMHIGHSDNPAILVFSRVKDRQSLSIIANSDLSQEQRGNVVLRTHRLNVSGLWGTKEAGLDLFQETRANVYLSPGYVLIVDTSELVENGS